jgi:hypothetical protein
LNQTTAGDTTLRVVEAQFLFRFGRPLWHVKKIEKKEGARHSCGRGNIIPAGELGQVSRIFFSHSTKTRTERVKAAQLIEGEHQFCLQLAVDWDRQWYHLTGVFIPRLLIPYSSASKDHFLRFD